jgi:hypothetical protein
VTLPDPLVVLGLLLVAGAVALWLHDLLEGESLLADLLDEWRLLRQGLAVLDTAWASNPARSRVIVSLTTIPSRLPLLEPTIKSLLRQTVAPERIILNLPVHSLREDRPYVLPEALRHLQGVEVFQCEDAGPATKLLPTITRVAPDQLVLIVDDDRIYHRSVLADLLAAARGFPGAAIGHSGWNVPPDLTDRPTTVYSNLFMRAPAPIRARRLRRPVQVDILQGLSGYLVRPDQFDLPGLTNYDKAPPEARLVDDVWIAAHRRAPAFVVPARRTNYPPLQGQALLSRSSLGLINRGPGGHALRSNSIVLRHFAGRWLADQPRRGG